MTGLLAREKQDLAMPYKPHPRRLKHGPRVSVGEAVVETPRVRVEIGEATDIRRDAYAGAGQARGPIGSMRDAERRRAQRMTGSRSHAPTRVR